MKMNEVHADMLITVDYFHEKENFHDKSMELSVVCERNDSNL